VDHVSYSLCPQAVEKHNTRSAMQEISPHVYIKTGYPGVTLAAIHCRRGLLLIDAPLRADDIRIWRSELANMSGGYERLLVTLDEHYDRTLGARQMECMIAGQERMTQVFKDRPLSFKTQGQETGSDWELIGGLGNIRWAAPEITFSHALNLYWDKFPILLHAQPGPSWCSTWVELPSQKIIFIGDTVLSNAPPFLAQADLPAWQASISLLLSPVYRDYTFVSGRSGVVNLNAIKDQLKFLNKVEQQLDKLAGKENDPRELEHASKQLLKHFDHRGPNINHYHIRLLHGLQLYKKYHATASLTLVE
jgi:hypothetical protein